MNVNAELSLRLKREYYLPTGACWFNAKAVVQILAERGIAAMYVEGYASVPSSRDFDHAWAECGGQIVDPTWVELGDIHLVEYTPLRRWEASVIVPLSFDSMGTPMDEQPVTAHAIKHGAE